MPFLRRESAVWPAHAAQGTGRAAAAAETLRAATPATATGPDAAARRARHALLRAAAESSRRLSLPALRHGATAADGQKNVARRTNRADCAVGFLHPAVLDWLADKRRYLRVPELRAENWLSVNHGKGQLNGEIRAFCRALES